MKPRSEQGLGRLLKLAIWTLLKKRGEFAVLEPEPWPTLVPPVWGLWSQVQEAAEGRCWQSPPPCRRIGLRGPQGKCG